MSFAAKNADFLQLAGLIPFMIEEMNVAVRSATIGSGDFQPRANGVLAHRRMRAESDEHVEGTA